MAALSRRRSNVPDVWPGFVDALATLVMVVVFVLMVFTVFQFYLKDVISGRDEALGRLRTELGQINELLTAERGASADLRTRLDTTGTALRETTEASARLQTELTASSALRDRLTAELAETRGRAETAEQTGARTAADLEAARRAIAESERTISADRERIDLQVRDLAALRRNVEDLTDLRRDLEARVAALGDDLGAARGRAERAEQARAQTQAAAQQAASEAERTIASDRERIELQMRDLAALGDDLGATRGRAERAEQAQAQTQAAARQAAEESQRTIAADRSQIEVQTRDLAELRRNVGDLSTLRRDLEARVAALDGEIAQREQALAAERVESERGRQVGAELQSDLTRVRASLAGQIAELRLMRTALDTERAEVDQRRAAERDLARQIDQLRTQLMRTAAEADETRRALATEQEVHVADARALVETQRRREEGEQRAASLDQEAAGLRAEIARLNLLLGTGQQQLAAQGAQISDLNTRLAAALASRVEELTRYRSEFFGRLRTVFEGRSGIRIEGDRFILESEVLFGVGSADLGIGGFDQLDRIADTLRDLIGQIPSEVPWVLQVEGHTDRRPVAGRTFRSNWELSTARAISVMRYLVERGIPPDRIAVAGYGEFQPIDRGDTEASFARNRRIELRFTSR